MKTSRLATLAAGLLVSIAAFAAAPAGAPADSTGLCKDGTYYTGAEKKGACKGHKGVKDWWGEEPKAAVKADTKADAKTAAKTDTKADAKTDAKPVPAAAAKPEKAKQEPPKPAATQAPGGGPGLVWANDNTKVYHCQGDKWYGRTKHGEYMSEADAKAKGFKGDRGKGCAKS